MTLKADARLFAKIASAEHCVRRLRSSQTRLNEGKRSQATDELVQHCREMAEILIAAVGQLGEGIEENATRAVKRSGMH